MKNTDPVMGAKFKSKTYLQITFFIFEPFFGRLASKFEKSTNMTLIFFFIKKDVEKRRISH